MNTSPIICTLAACCIAASAAIRLAGPGWQAGIAADGTLETWEADFGDGTWQTVAFAQDKSAGPAWYFRREEKIVRPALTNRVSDQPEFTGTEDGIQFRLAYGKDAGGGLAIVAEATNTTDKAWRPETAGIKIGIDCLMKSYPEWMHRFAPTMLRCEKTHFWGYPKERNG